MVWDGTGLNERTAVVAIANCTLNILHYISDILEPGVFPFAINMGSGFVLQHDGARPQVAQIVSVVLSDYNIEVIECRLTVQTSIASNTYGIHWDVNL